MSIGISPTSSAWQYLTGSSVAYGLTDGAMNANTIKLTGLGRRLVAPEAEGADIAARREAILRPRIMKDFFERYRRAKFPNDTIAVNVLRSLGIPPERVQSAVVVLKDNGKYAGIVRDIPTGPFVNLDSSGIPAPASTPVTPAADAADNHAETEHSSSDQSGTKPFGAAPPPIPSIGSFPPKLDPGSNRVFISHGKQKVIVIQIKELLSFGNFDPVVSIERESMAIPVPEKVFEDMRSGAAGVIHLGAEGKYLDRDGNEHTRINDNVLIEIGAAMALYGEKMILLVEKGRFRQISKGFIGVNSREIALSTDATMKLLKTFSQFR